MFLKKLKKKAEFWKKLDMKKKAILSRAFATQAKNKKRSLMKPRKKLRNTSET